MAMQPSVLILDEPTSQLDPIAAADFLATVGRINKELGTTIIMTEHRLEEVFQ
jgi:energy-coupling factor transport system ATP-binding protein